MKLIKKIRKLLKSISLYINTIKYMKLDQILYRILFAIRKVNINKNIEIPNIRDSSFALKDYIYKNNSTNNGKSFTFLNLGFCISISLPKSKRLPSTKV